MNAVHRPVMVSEVVASLQPRPKGLYVDATVGLGGHALALLETEPGAAVIGFDVDGQALASSRQTLAPHMAQVTLVHAPYLRLAEWVQDQGIDAVDGVLFDLGVSSLQLDSPERGFSFRFDAPLDMRFSESGETAADLLAELSEEELVRVIREYGEEPRARRVARAITRARSQAPIRTTGDLARILRPALGPRKGRTDPLTRTFQALRIATNRELDDLPRALQGAATVLRPAGRLVVIAFHSIEDRIVKRTFRHLSGRCVCPPGMPVCGCEPQQILEIVTPRPLRPTTEEAAVNPRARSARLRVATRR